MTNTEDGQLEASSTVTSFDVAVTYNTSTHLWSLADTEAPNVQANTVTITELNDDLVAPSDALALTGSDSVPGTSSTGVLRASVVKTKPQSLSCRFAAAIAPTSMMVSKSTMLRKQGVQNQG